MMKNKVLFIEYEYSSKNTYNVSVYVQVGKTNVFELQDTFSLTMNPDDSLETIEDSIYFTVKHKNPSSAISWKNLWEVRNNICDMAMERAVFYHRCLDLFSPVYEHLLKICLWRNSREVNHWKSEVYGNLKTLMSYKVKNDNKSNRIRNAAFADSFIYGYLGENFSSYDTLIRSDIEDVINEEGLNIGDYDIDYVSLCIKPEVLSFLRGLIDVFKANDNKLLRDYVEAF